MPSPLPSYAPLESGVVGILDYDFGSGDLTDELTRAKGLLLYSDHVSVQSYRAVFLMARLTMQLRTLRTRLGAVLDQISISEDVMLEMLQERGSWSNRNFGEDDLKQLARMSPAEILEMPEIMRSLILDSSSGRAPVRLDNARLFRDFSEMSVRRWVEFKPDERPASAIVSMRELNRLYDLGLVTTYGGPIADMWEPAEENLLQTLQGVLLRTVEAAETRGAKLLLTAGSPRSSDRQISLANQAAIAGQLIGELPNLGDLPLDELLEVRKHVFPYVASFRASIATLEEQIRASDEPIDRIVQDFRLRQVDPALQEINEAFRDNGVLRVAARGMPFTASGLIGLGVTAAIGGPVLAGVATVAAGLTGAIAQEFLRRKSAEAASSKGSFFFLWKAEKEAIRRRSS